jgi:hypothetical protein
VTDGERQLILRRLHDKGILPYNGQMYDETSIRQLTPREREVLRDIARDDCEYALKSGIALLQAGPTNQPLIIRLKHWILSIRWRFKHRRLKKSEGVTNEEREMILRQLLDKGLLPYEGGPFDDAAVRDLTGRELAILTEEVKSYQLDQLAKAIALLRNPPDKASMMTRLYYRITAINFQFHYNRAKRRLKKAENENKNRKGENH